MWRELMGMFQDSIPAARIEINHRNKGTVAIEDIPEFISNCRIGDQIHIKIVPAKAHNLIQMIADEL